MDTATGGREHLIIGEGDNEFELVDGKTMKDGIEVDLTKTIKEDDEEEAHKPTGDPLRDDEIAAVGEEEPLL